MRWNRVDGLTLELHLVCHIKSAVTAAGSGSKAHLVVTKTDAAYRKAKQQHAHMFKEIQTLQTVVSDRNSALVQDLSAAQQRVLRQASLLA